MMMRTYMHCLSASPCPWKKRNERPKSAMKIRTRLMTTALVVLSPTPLAPPVVVKPQLQLITEIIVPNLRGRTDERGIVREAGRRVGDNARGNSSQNETGKSTHTHAFIILTMMSQLSMAREALSRMTLALTPYTASAKTRSPPCPS